MIITLYVCAAIATGGHNCHAAYEKVEAPDCKAAFQAVAEAVSTEMLFSSPMPGFPRQIHVRQLRCRQ